MRSGTTSYWVEKSWTVEDEARVARKEKLELARAWFDTDSEADSTSTAACAATEVGHKCFCAGHVARETLQMLGSLIEAYGMTLEDMEVSAFVLRPSCLWYLSYSC